MNRILALVLIAFAPIAANADLFITEILFDLRSGSDSGREWIEVFNAGTATENMLEWRLFENGTHHKITTSGMKDVAPGTYAIIAADVAKFKVDWPNYAGLVLDSAFSLSNDGETISLRKGNADFSPVSYSSSIGGDGTGDSLQRSSLGDAFEAGVPTPGSGIPPGGLAKSPPKESKSSANEAVVSSGSELEIVGEPDDPNLELVAAAVVADPPHDELWAWWLAPLALASIGSTGILVSRHYRKDEWDIIEEKDDAR